MVFHWGLVINSFPGARDVKWKQILEPSTAIRPEPQKGQKGNTREGVPTKGRKEKKNYRPGTGPTCGCRTGGGQEFGKGEGAYENLPKGKSEGTPSGHQKQDSADKGPAKKKAEPEIKQTKNQTNSRKSDNTRRGEKILGMEARGKAKRKFAEGVRRGYPKRACKGKGYEKDWKGSN